MTNENTNQLSLVYVSLVQCEYYNDEQYLKIEEQVFLQLDHLTPHNLINFLSCYSLLPGEDRSLVSHLSTILANLSSESSTSESTLIQNTIKMSYNLMLLDEFSKSAQPFWE